MPKNQQARHVHLALALLGKNPTRWFTAWEASGLAMQYERRRWSRALDELADSGYVEKRHVESNSKDRGGMVEFKFKELPYVASDHT